MDLGVNNLDVFFEIGRATKGFVETNLRLHNGN
jgi:hypothetical protein